MTAKRKTELGRDLQRRADACLLLAETPGEDADTVRLLAKANAYSHAAELADTYPVARVSQGGDLAQDLPPGWCRRADDAYGPGFVGPHESTVQVNDLEGETAYIRSCGDGIPIDVLRAFIAALDDAS